MHEVEGLERPELLGAILSICIKRTIILHGRHKLQMEKACTLYDSQNGVIYREYNIVT